MMHMVRTAAVVLAVVARASSLITCNANNPCPASSPCCSSYGFCGVGAYCLGGCDPKYSHSLQSCVAAPVCKDADYKLTSLDSVVPNTQYLGDASKANWVSSGTPVAYNNEAVLLTMAPSTVGTLLSSTHYVWYGKISATMTTSQGAGVVTAFILMSDVKDEIDFEFVGVDLQHAQSNYYFQGITDYENGGNLTASNTQSDIHTYTIDWQPDYISWSIDGKVMRTKNRNDTYNSTTQQYHFPQTPARIQLSLWPAGLASNGQGTIEWSGGLVNWDSSAMQNGYYYAMIKEVKVECYDPPSGYKNKGSKSYYYDSAYGTNDTVVTSNNNTILSSFYATGENPSYNPDASSSSTSRATGTSTSAAAASSTNVETVPGDSGAGTRGDESANAQLSSSPGDSSGSSSAGSSSSGSGSTSFVQGNPNGGTNDGARVVAGSLVALVAFFAAAMML